MPLSYTMKFAVHASEVTPCYALKPFHLLNMLQDAADGAVDSMQLPCVADFGCAWMLHQYSIVLSRPLMSGASGTINTGHVPQGDLFSIRRFILHDDAGAEIGMADSAWILVDLKRRRPCRLSRKLPAYFFERAEPVPFDEHFTDPAAPDREDIVRMLDVRLGDLDVNGHVNNAYYLSWFSEAIPQDVYMTCGIQEAHIVYTHEATYGMQLRVSTRQDGLSFRHVICNQDGSEIARALTRWAPAEQGKTE
ncbi:MAG: thioesterase [Pyramidobacter sp.]|nr:thioesterase [Pyramidobacter sp.]